MISDKGDTERPMEFRRYRDRSETDKTATARPSSSARDADAARAYRQGYLDASSNYISSPLLDVPRSKDARTSAVPWFMREFALDYPYTTLASIGVIGTLTLLSSGYVTAKVFRRMAYGSKAAEVNVKGGPGKDTLSAVWNKRLDDMERRTNNNIQSANRDRKAEIDTLKREILSSLTTHATAGTVIGIEDKLDNLVVQIKASNRDILGQVQASNRDRRSEFHNFRSEIMGQLQMMEQRVVLPESQDSETAEGWKREFMDRLETSNRDRRTELHNFRSEIMGQLQMMEEQIKASRSESAGGYDKSKGRDGSTKLAPGDLKATAPIAPTMDEARLGQVLRGAVEDVLEAKAGLFASPKPKVSLGGDAPGRSIEENLLGHSPTPSDNAPITQSDSLADVDSKADQTLEWHRDDSLDQLSGARDTDEGAHLLSGLRQRELVAQIDEASDGHPSTTKAQKEPVFDLKARYETALRSLSTVPQTMRYGVDDSGNWKILFTSQNYDSDRRGGEAILIYENSSNDEWQTARKWSKSASHERITYTNVEVKFDDTFPLLRIDGRTWNYEQQGDAFVIKREAM